MGGPDMAPHTPPRSSRHGSPGARRAWGGVGGHLGAPHVQQMIGESHRRLGGERLVSGAGCFVEYVRMPGMLHAAVLRSPHALARLLSIYAKRARELPGVRLVLTAADVPAAAVLPIRVPAPAGPEPYLQPPTARALA